MEQPARALAEEAIRALGRGDAPAARTAVALAYEADHSLGPLADIVYLASSELENDGLVLTATWNTLADAVAGTGQLLAAVESTRTG